MKTKKDTLEDLVKFALRNNMHVHVTLVPNHGTPSGKKSTKGSAHWRKAK